MICSICGMIFKDNGSFNRHVNDHSVDNVQKKCDVCEYVGNAKNLYQHKQNKHEQKQMSCNNCEKKFTTKSNLNRHIKKDHEFQEHKSHVCSSCGKQLSSKQKLYYTFLEYENLLYVDKSMFNKTKSNCIVEFYEPNQPLPAPPFSDD